MTFEYPAEIIIMAQDLYCVDRQTYEKVAKKLKVSLGTVKRWGLKYNWRAKRKALAEAESQIKIDTIKARAKVLERLLSESGTAQDAFAVSALENLALKQDELKKEPIIYKLPKIENESQAANLLEEALQQKLALIIAEPYKLDLKIINDLKGAWSLVKEMKEAKIEAGENKGLSAETENRIRAILTGSNLCS